MMAVFTFNNMGSTGGTSNNWNYSDKAKPDFALQIDGTVVEMKQVQETQYQTNAPLFWKNDGGRAVKVVDNTGQPCLNFCIVIDTDQFGEKEWTFNPKTKKDMSIDPNTGMPRNPDGLSKASFAIQQALVEAGMDATNLDQIGGMHISVCTKEPPEGFDYGPTSPRPFGVKINGMGNKKFRGCFPFGQSPKPPVMQVPAQKPMQQQVPQTRLQQVMEQAQANAAQARMQQQGSLPQQQPQAMQPAAYEQVPVDVYNDTIPF